MKPSRASLNERTSGVLLHPTSLPGPHGSGDLGRPARWFADVLAEAGQRFWQMLPVGPAGHGNSPYSAPSAFAGSPALISLEALADDGLLAAEDLARPPRFPRGRVDYEASGRHRERHLRAAFAAFAAGRGGAAERRRHRAFVERSRAWLDDFALFVALKQAHGGVEWTAWDEGVRARRAAALERARRRFEGEIAYRRFEQFLFDGQWRALCDHCAAKGVGLLGDVPIFVAHDSSDVWAHPDLFLLDRRGRPAVVAGVPPDYFSRTGQRWGNPLYRWPTLKRRRYGWWIDRLRITLSRFDAVRLDHFIGFHRSWAIPASSPTAVVGRWLPGPGADFFSAVERALGLARPLPFVAEDLGVVTPEVKALRDRFGLPGIRVLQFAFGSDPSAADFLPHNYPRNAVAYTGTHDNDTTVGWATERAGGHSTRSAADVRAERKRALEYLGGGGAEIHWDMIRMVELSVANTAIVPLQDVLGLGSEARMNRPGIAADNWEWRLDDPARARKALLRLGRLSQIYGRAP